MIFTLFKHKSLFLLLLIISILVTTLFVLKYNNIILNEPIIPYDYKQDESRKVNDKSITWILHNYVPIQNAGGEVMLHAMNKYLIQEGYTVNVIVPTFPIKRYEDVNIYTFNDREQIQGVIQRSKFIGTHFHFSLMAVKTASIAKKPIIIVIHDEIQKPYLEVFNKIYSKENIHLIYNSFWIKKLYNSSMIRSDKIIAVFPPVFWKDYQVETNRKYVTLINCNTNKGGYILIELAKLMPDIEFLGVEGAYNSQIKDNSIKNITYYKSTPNIEYIYKQTDIIIMPSKQETWGRVAIEAISSGIPVIANPTEGLREALDYCGIYVSYTDIKRWVNTIRKLKTDENYYKKVSQLCIKRSRELEPSLQLKVMEQWLQKIEYK